MPIIRRAISTDLEAAAAIGTRAGDRAVARLNPGKLASGPMPVVFDPRVGSGLLGHLTGAITGSAVARRTSFLLDRLGEEVFAQGHHHPRRSAPAARAALASRSMAKGCRPRPATSSPMAC